ncbi:MAG: hypothetical protein ABR525_07265, partial [Candidatus Limnocylindria bacterium]
WYDVAFNVDVSGRAYRLTVARSDATAPFLDQSTSWASPGATGIDAICFSSPEGNSGGSLYVNELHLTAR